MNLMKKLLVRLQLRPLKQEDVNQGIKMKNAGWLRFIIKFGAHPERASAVIGLGRIKSVDSVPVILPLLWDDFESVAKAAKRSLEFFLPNTHVEKMMQKAAEYWIHKAAQRSQKRQIIYKGHTSPHPTRLVDKSKMKMLAKVKEQLKKPIRFS